MERKKLWVKGESWTVEGQEGIVCGELQKMLYSLSSADIVKIDTDNRENRTYITSGHWEEENDAEFKQRLANEQMSKRNKSNLVVIHTSEYDQLREKAAMYDQLCK